MDPGAQVRQALVGVPTEVRSGVSGVWLADNYGVLQLVLILQPKSGTRPADWNGTSTAEGEKGPRSQKHLGLVRQEFGVQMDRRRVREV